MKRGIGMLFTALALLAQAEAIVVSIESNAVLRAEGMEPGTGGSVEYTDQLAAGFTNRPALFSGLVADGAGMIHVPLVQTNRSMFFRVKGIVTGAVPAGMAVVPLGINSGSDPDFGTYALTNGAAFFADTPEGINEAALYMDTMEVTNDEMVQVMQWAYDNGKIWASASGVRNAEGEHRELLDLDDADCRITWDGSLFGMKSTKGSGYPCVEVSWYGAAAYCNYRSEMEGKTPCYDLSDWSCDFGADGYRLPTGDEWEYAARGGLSGRRFPWGDTIAHTNANCFSFSAYSYDTSATGGYHPDYDVGDLYTSPSGAFAPNGYGLYDMAGNVREWCWDPSESDRCLRGGSWISRTSNARCGSVDRDAPDGSTHFYGFRTVCR